jgi:hypothetical protein
MTDDSAEFIESDWADVHCREIDEARWGRSVLEAAGIEAVIPDEHTLALPLSGAEEPGTVRLLVRAADLERALDVLQGAGRRSYGEERL